MNELERRYAEYISNVDGNELPTSREIIYFSLLVSRATRLADMTAILFNHLLYEIADCEYGLYDEDSKCPLECLNGCGKCINKKDCQYKGILKDLTETLSPLGDFADLNPLLQVFRESKPHIVAFLKEIEDGKGN